MKNKSHLTAFLFILAIIIFAASCGGGGGGGGSVVSFGNSSKPHNGGDAGGWGTGAQNGNGFGGNGGGLGSSGDSNIVITGSTPLEVGTYNYNGASYDSVEALYAALAANTLEDVFYVDFQVEGESTPRKARVTANGKSNDGNDILIEHQYKAFFPDENGGTQEVLFYKRDGIELPGGSGTVNIDGFEFEKGWQIDGSFAPAGSIIGVASGGDIDLQDRAVLKTAVYGYKADTGASGGYILGFNSSELTAGDTVTVTTDRKITKLKLPSTSIGFLDLSGATDFKTVNLEPDNAGSLQEIKLPSNAETIAMSAFSGCTNLNSVTLPSTLTSIQTEAFSGCSHLQSITIPAGVTSLADDTFKNCSSLSSVTFAPGSQLTTINKRVFEGCSSLVLSTLPSSVETIGEYAFKGCTSLTSFTIPDGVTQLKGTFQNCSQLASISIPSSVNILQENAFNGVSNGCQLIFDSTGSSMGYYNSNAMPQGSYKVKITGTGIPRTDLGESIFNSYLSEVTLANTVTAIPQKAFQGCSALTKVTIENTPAASSLAAIGASAFYGCTSLQTINIPGTVNAIGSSAFGQAGSGNLTITFDGGQNQIMTNTSSIDTGGTEYKVVLKQGVPKAGSSSIFATDSNLREVVYAGGYTLIANAFTGCSRLNTVTFESYPSIIEHNSSSDYVFPDNVTNIIIGSGQVPISNVENVGHLLTPGRNFTSKPLAVTFFNDPDFPDITILAGAFNFTDADRITYQFIAQPSVHMTYGAGTCFKTDVPVHATAGGTTYTWDSITKSWQP